MKKIKNFQNIHRALMEPLLNNVYRLALPALCMLAMASCTPKPDPEAADQSESSPASEQAFDITATQFESSEMALGKMEMKAFHEIVKAKGMVDVPPANRASVSSYFGGTVKEINLLEGQSVKKGQVLFTLENPDFIQIQQDYLEAKGQMAFLKSDYERQTNLAKDNVSSQKTFLKAESDYTVTKVKMESLGKKLALMNIDPSALSIENLRSTIPVSSPIDGFVTDVAIARGAFLTPSQLAVTIVNMAQMHLELDVFERDLTSIRVGQPIIFKLQEARDTAYEASVHLINKTVDAESRTVGILGHLANETAVQNLNPGMYVEAEIYTTSTERLALPQNAIVDIEGRYYVLLQRDDSEAEYSFLKREVLTGMANNGHVEILNHKNFDENQMFLVNGAFNLIKE